MKSSSCYTAKSATQTRLDCPFHKIPACPLQYNHSWYHKPWHNLCWSLDCLCVWKWGLPLGKRRVLSFWVGTIFVALYTWVYLHSFQVRGVCALWTSCMFNHCSTMNNIYARYMQNVCHNRLMQLIYFTTPKLQLATWMAIGLTTAKLLVHHCTLSSCTYMWI
jgi:hypothetical protein